MARFRGAEPADIPVEHDLSGKPAGEHRCIRWCSWRRRVRPTPPGDTKSRDRLLAAAQALDKRSPTYYGAAWVAIGRIMLTTTPSNCC